MDNFKNNTSPMIHIHNRLLTVPLIAQLDMIIPHLRNINIITHTYKKFQSYERTYRHYRITNNRNVSAAFYPRRRAVAAQIAAIS